MVRLPLSSDIATDSAEFTILSPGHSYHATASCANSKLTSASNVATKRDGRDSFIGREIFAWIMIGSDSRRCQASASTINEHIGVSFVAPSVEISAIPMGLVWLSVTLGPLQDIVPFAAHNLTCTSRDLISHPASGLPVSAQSKSLCRRLREQYAQTTFPVGVPFGQCDCSSALTSPASN